jgi:uncharacterized protein
MDVQKIIDKYYPANDELRNIYMVHAACVAKLSLEFSRRHPELCMDNDFIEEAAMLHDLGIFLTDAPGIHCYGSAPYICHGFLGAELLRKEGFARHALVCERHTGTGLTKELIAEKGWPLPHIDMRPQSLEEQVICFADKFYSKTKYLYEPRTFEQVKVSMAKISQASVDRVEEWQKLFG